MGFGGNPYGPAGTGKTESVKALGQAFGRQVRPQTNIYIYAGMESMGELVAIGRTSPFRHNSSFHHGHIISAFSKNDFLSSSQLISTRHFGATSATSLHRDIASTRDLLSQAHKRNCTCDGRLISSVQFHPFKVYRGRRIANRSIAETRLRDKKEFRSSGWVRLSTTMYGPVIHSGRNDFRKRGGGLIPLIQRLH